MLFLYLYAIVFLSLYDGQLFTLPLRAAVQNCFQFMLWLHNTLCQPVLGNMIYIVWQYEMIDVFLLCSILFSLSLKSHLLQLYFLLFGLCILFLYKARTQPRNIYESNTNKQRRVNATQKTAGETGEDKTSSSYLKQGLLLSYGWFGMKSLAQISPPNSGWGQRGKLYCTYSVGRIMWSKLGS